MDEVYTATMSEWESGGWAIRDISTRCSVDLLATDIPDQRPKNIAFPLMEVSRTVDGGIESGDRIPLKSSLRGIALWQEWCSTSGRRLNESGSDVAEAHIQCR
jgi:hypothetical protein